MWPRPPFVQCERDQARLLDPARTAGAEYRAELEPGADRPGADRLSRSQGRGAPPRGDALAPDPLLGEGHQDRLLDINARAEEVDTKPAFREAFRQRRCLVPLDSFHESKKIGTGKQPNAIALADRRLMGMAGLWETCRSPAGERVRSFTIVTTTPNELCAELHNRMPVVLKPDAW